MKKKKIFFVLGIATTILSISAFTLVNSNGSQIYYTDSPVDGPGDCSSCHHGGSATCVPTFSASPAFGSGNTFMPGVTYTISVGETGYPYYGFDLEICNKNSAVCTDGGTFVAAVSSCQFHAPASPYPTNVTHTATTPTATKAKFTWKAPASGKAYMYMDMNGVNGDGSTSGDKPVADSIVLSPSPTAIVELEEHNTNLSFFPNPATDQIALSYSLDKPSVVEIQLYDINGRLVSTLLKQTTQTGEQHYAAALPAELGKGIYTLTLLVDGQPTVKKLMIR
jgi:hypothetical protein